MNPSIEDLDRRRRVEEFDEFAARKKNLVFEKQLQRGEMERIVVAMNVFGVWSVWGPIKYNFSPSVSSWVDVSDPAPRFFHVIGGSLLGEAEAWETKGYRMQTRSMKKQPSLQLRQPQQQKRGYDGKDDNQNQTGVKGGNGGRGPKPYGWDWGGRGGARGGWVDGARAQKTQVDGNTVH